MQIRYRVVPEVARPAFRIIDCTTTLFRTKIAAMAMMSATRIVMFMVSP